MIDTDPLDIDDAAVQLRFVQVADALGGVLGGCHGDVAITASARRARVRHDLGADHLAKLGEGCLEVCGPSHRRKAAHP